MKKADLYRIIFVIGVMVAFVVYVYWKYYNRFFNVTTSDNPEHWGTFGDFVGGVLNPIISLANVILVGLIAYYLKNVDDERSKKELETQKKILLSQLRHEAFKELSKKFELIYKIFFDEALDPKVKSIKLSFEMLAIKEFYFTHHNYLFPKLTEKMVDDILEKLKVLTEIVTIKDLNFDEKILPYIEKKEILENYLKKFTIDELK